MAAKKKTAKKTPAKKSAAKKKSATTKKSAGAKKKKTASTRKKAATAKADVDAPEAADSAEAVDDAGLDDAASGRAEPAERAEAVEAEMPDRPAAGGLRRGRRRRLPAARRPDLADGAGADIPPLPDEADLPAFGRPSAPPPAPVRGDEDPRQLLDRVRRGQAHVSDLGRLPEDALRQLARDEGLAVADQERVTDIAVRLVTHQPARGGRNGRDGREGAVREGGGRARRERRERTPSPREPAPDEPTGEVETVRVEGLLEMHPDGYGFLRRSERGYSQHPEDVYVAAALLRRVGLQPGHYVAGEAHRPRPGQAYLALQTVEEVNHQDPAVLADVIPFKDLTVVYPDTRLPLEVEPTGFEMRIMDLFCPVGRGQRGLIVAPPRSGKTVLLTKLADAIATNSPDVDIVVLLVDERPEEVTNMRRSVRGEVIASTFDKPAANHVRVAELVMEKVKRMVELKRNVVLLLDSITRLGRAYNNMTGGSGRILTGGLDANALTKPKRFFGSARNVEDGGSLTIIATSLVDTGSKLDQVIFEEFKGTGNMECVLSRDLSNARIWPAIDVPASGTRNEDLLLHPDEMAQTVRLRRAVTGLPAEEVMRALIVKLKEFPTNREFLMALGDGGM
ncbi:MAG: transcription termination factor Rho [Planctomycetota bacterium]